MISKNNFIVALGLMSGTSMDGIDAAIINSDGLKIKNNKYFCFTQYSKTTSKLLFNALNNATKIVTDKDLQEELSYKVTIDHFIASERLINQTNIKPEIIGFHGQTIFHNPKKKKTLQLGNAQLLSNLLQIDVISNFRENDIQYGGEGAPLAPIFHEMLIKKYNLQLPSCFLNIGGVSNITYFDGVELIGFDVGPGNGLMDDYMKKKLNKNFDNDGFLCSQGKINIDLLEQFCNESFFSKPFPKSLDRNSFKSIAGFLESRDLSIEDSMATLAEFTIKSIDLSIKELPKIPKSIIIVGGGSKNQHIVKRLKILFGNIINISDDIGVCSESVEAEMMGFLAIRNIYSLPITFPKTTGVKNPLTGGKIYKFK